jgi:uncharacterized protein YkwD
MKVSIAIAYLEKATKQPAMVWSEELAQACMDHYLDISKSGSFNHVGSDKSSYKDRIERYCRWGGSIFESLDFMVRDDPHDIVLAWLIDDGNQKRNRRDNLMAATNKHCAVVFGAHSDSENCAVALFAAQIVPL